MSEHQHRFVFVADYRCFRIKDAEEFTIEFFKCECGSWNTDAVPTEAYNV